MVVTIMTKNTSEEWTFPEIWWGPIRKVITEFAKQEQYYEETKQKEIQDKQKTLFPEN
jgi:hypothetical protein